VSGKIVLSSEKAIALKEVGEPLILVRDETSPEDIGGMAVARGILTSRGGMTSHAAVVARGMGKCCVVGAGEVHIDGHQGLIKLGGYILKEGDWITLDGGTGEVFLGVIPTVEPEVSGALADLMKRADLYRKLKVRANADTPHDARVALDFGAEGIGLCRTEHMFFGADRIDVVRAMILAEVKSEREEALAKLLPMQRKDFYEIFQVMKDRPVTIRFLDPPLHEFLPHSDREVKELAARLQLDPAKLQARVKALHEFNPMLGHRGSRLAITFPEIYAMQSQAVAEAAAQFYSEGGRPIVEIMLPLIAFAEEIEVLRRQVVEIVEGIRANSGQNFSYTVGTMIELPRAAIMAEQIAKHADFFSFGTNDLTQTTLGLSRDDSSRFLPSYLAHGVITRDPFVSLDVEGVGSLVKLAVDRARASKSDFKAGICGEHGGDPDSIRFFHEVGLDYVSCSPYRVPIARLAAAQAALRAEAKV
jgi:pyruvate,orthophosphate dikinase